MDWDPKEDSVMSRTQPSDAGRGDRGDRIVDLFAFNLLPLAFKLTPPMDRGDRPPAAYPDGCLLAVAAAGQLPGSVGSVVDLLHDNRDVWERCRAAYLASHGVELASDPPGASDVLEFTALVCDPDNPYLNDLLVAQVTYHAIWQAEMDGALRPNDYFPTTDDSTASTITLMSKPSGIGSADRTTLGEGPDRFSPTVTTVWAELQTASGPVVLATSCFMGRAFWQAAEMIDRLVERLGDRVQCIVHDRVLTLAAAHAAEERHGIQVVGPPDAPMTDDDVVEYHAVGDEDFAAALLSMSLDAALEALTVNASTWAASRR
jgi:hypothetical protein